MNTFRTAIIDCGTNTFHLLIIDLKDGRIEELVRTKTAVKIGKGGINDGHIIDAARERAVAALSEFKSTIDEYQPAQVLAYATSAFRSAENGKEVVVDIFQRTGIAVEVIGGMEEARLIFDGVCHALGKMSKTSLVVDIGGGSVEFIIGKEDQVLWMESYEIGGQRLMDHFFTDDPISMDAVGQMKEFLQSRLQTLQRALERFNPTVLVGSSGSFETLSAMYAAREGIELSPDDRELPLTLPAINAFYSMLLKSTRKERLSIPGMVEMRADMIVVASILIDFLCQIHHFNDVRVSKYALKEGVMARLLDENTL